MTMNEGANDLALPEEEILFCDVSDEALEAAADNGGMAAPTPSYWTSSCYAACCQR
jgi:hypothetical protein